MNNILEPIRYNGGIIWVDKEATILEKSTILANDTNTVFIANEYEAEKPIQRFKR